MIKIIEKVKKELQELKELGVCVPDFCFDERKIKDFFEDFDGTHRQLSNMINLFILLADEE